MAGGVVVAGRLFWMVMANSTRNSREPVLVVAPEQVFPY
jgi:hypothetical protein